MFTNLLLNFALVYVGFGALGLLLAFCAGWPVSGRQAAPYGCVLPLTLFFGLWLSSVLYDNVLLPLLGSPVRELTGTLAGLSVGLSAASAAYALFWLQRTLRYGERRVLVLLLRVGVGAGLAALFFAIHYAHLFSREQTLVEVLVHANPWRKVRPLVFGPVATWTAASVALGLVLFELTQAPVTTAISRLRCRLEARQLQQAITAIDQHGKEVRMATNNPGPEAGGFDLARVEHDFQLLRAEGKSRSWLLHWLETNKAAGKANASTRELKAREELFRQLRATVEAHEQAAEVAHRHQRLPERLKHQEQVETVTWQTERLKHEAELAELKAKLTAAEQQAALASELGPLEAERRRLEAQAEIVRLKRQLEPKPEPPAQTPFDRLAADLARAEQRYEGYLAQGFPPEKARELVEAEQREIRARYRLRGS